jgi:hypothetical protein
LLAAISSSWTEISSRLQSRFLLSIAWINWYSFFAFSRSESFGKRILISRSAIASDEWHYGENHFQEPTSLRIMEWKSLVSTTNSGNNSSTLISPQRLRCRNNIGSIDLLKVSIIIIEFQSIRCVPILTCWENRINQEILTFLGVLMTRAV